MYEVSAAMVVGEDITLETVASPATIVSPQEAPAFVLLL